jgi:hypothetical protein
MGYLDTYAKDVLRAAAGAAFLYCGSSVLVNYGSGRPCRIDGTLGCTVSIMRRGSTSGSGSEQCRPAVLARSFHGP